VTPIDPNRKRQQRQYIGVRGWPPLWFCFGVGSKSTPRATPKVGILIGLPVISVLLYVAIRWGRRSSDHQNIAESPAFGVGYPTAPIPICAGQRFTLMHLL
jgi:hypothetical protein